LILLIDNYDSFVFNLARYVGELGYAREVVRNDAVTLEQIETLAPEAIILSPGPCTPKEAGISNAVIASLGARIPILGVCLGHQCIGAAFGGEIIRAPSIMHGKLSEVTHDGQTIYRSVKNPFAAMRYHSLVINPERLPAEFDVSARTADGVIMSVRHRKLPIEGVQFHPESILTEEGKKLLKNFLDFY